MSAPSPTAQEIESWLRPRRARHHGRKRPRRKLGPAFAAGAPRSATPGSELAARLGMREPESMRHAMVSGSLSLLAHGAAVATLAISAWYAPEVAEELIPVRIIKDTTPAPEPAPARRVVVPKRTLAARSRLPTQVARTQPVARPTVQQVTAARPTVANIDTAAAPTQLQQRQITSQRVVAQRTLVATSPSAVGVAQFSVPAVAPTDLEAPQAAVTGPTRVAPVERVDVVAPQAFSNAPATAPTDYAEGTAATSAVAALPHAESGVGIDSDTAFALEGTGGVQGGRGTAAAGIPCDQRESVHVYVRRMSARVEAEWKRFELPKDLPADAKVKLAFVLDESGTARDIEVRSAPSPELGESCQRALVAASPFPAMTGNERCLAGRRRVATFSVPVAGTGGR